MVKRLKTIATLGLVGLLNIGGCMQYVGGTAYSYKKGNETKYDIIGERQPDGTLLYEYPRNQDLQRRIKGSLRGTIPEALRFQEDGTITDLHYIREFPDGSAQLEYYSN